MKRRGFYLVFEGIVGAGKTVQSKLLFERLKAEFPKREIILTKEPGSTEIAQEIRRVVQGMLFKEEMEPLCEQYLYAAARAQSLRKVVRPVLERGGVVVADRSFFTSLAYQGFGRGLGLKTVLAINRFAVDDLWPDKVFLIDSDVALCLRRTRDMSGDKFENYDKEFFNKVRRGYLAVAKKYPKIVEVIDGRGAVEKVQAKIYSRVATLI